MTATESKTMTAIPESHRDLLDTNQVAIVATVGPDGVLQVTASWFLPALLHGSGQSLPHPGDPGARRDRA